MGCMLVLQDRNLVDADCVLWHSFGVTHIPRMEDWPVMPAEHVGFFLKPFGFFDANPSLDIPIGRNMSSREHGVPVAACPSCGSKAHTSKNPHPMMHIKSVKLLALPATAVTSLISELHAHTGRGMMHIKRADLRSLLWPCQLLYLVCTFVVQFVQLILANACALQGVILDCNSCGHLLFHNCTLKRAKIPVT